MTVHQEIAEKIYKELLNYNEVQFWSELDRIGIHGLLQRAAKVLDERKDELKDHYYYLVEYKNYETPIKAKWHNDFGGHWEIFIGNGKPNEFVYEWDDNNTIKSWIQLPSVATKNSK